MINNISFGASTYDKYKNYSRESASHSNHTQADFEDFDTFQRYEEAVNKKDKCESKAPKTPKKSKGSQEIKRLKPWQKFALGLALSGACTTAGAGSVAIVREAESPTPKTVIIENIDDYDTIEQVASKFGTNGDYILEYNDAKDIDALQENEEVYVPYKYNAAEERIDKLSKKIYSNNVSNRERKAMLKEISELEDKQKIQDSAALAYQDGHKVFFKMKQNVSVNEFKELFDIKDGVLKQYNEEKSKKYIPVGDKIEENSELAELVKGNTYFIRLSDFEG